MDRNALEVLRGQRVLITGGSGFLGSHLCRVLMNGGAHPIGMSRGDRAAGAGPRWLTGDVSDAAAVRAAWRAARPDVVFHLATHGIGAPDLDNVPGTLTGDLVATVNVLTIAAQEGCSRVVLAASLEEPTTAAAVPASPYAAAKWAATGYARMFHALYKTPVVIARPFMTYGPGQRKQKLIPRTIHDLLLGRPPLLSSGRRRVDWVYVDDVIRGLVLAAAQPGIAGAEFDLGSGQLVPVGEVVRRVAQLMDSAVRIEFGALSDRPLEVERSANLEATFACVRWKPEIGLDEGLRRTIQWVRAHGPRRGVSL